MRFPGLAGPPVRKRNGSHLGKPHVVIICDPGPDPDDAKTLLLAATKHHNNKLILLGVVCNGGHQAEQRARLAKAILNFMGLHRIPVGVGSSGQPYEPKDHEYAFPGWDRVARSDLQDGESLLRRILTQAAPRSICWVCISALTDIEQLIRSSPDQFVRATERLCIQGGLQ